MLVQASITAAVAMPFDARKTYSAAPPVTQIAPIVTHKVPPIARAHPNLLPPSIVLISLNESCLIGIRF